ncbi:hypothetical protein EG68_00500 [Paragonimus skrjabini miyazakii]|uniref:Uncharacterized protein n=1 Tax=Paragonimus skrjabini miyazakii TaxID=59628 RepID=A0A8S9ZCN0_9TREM|nr:hypothetical protein EG68_00500 [Paragonimus skrjabini miyazakii]
MKYFSKHLSLGQRLEESMPLTTKAPVTNEENNETKYCPEADDVNRPSRESDEHFPFKATYDRISATIELIKFIRNLTATMKEITENIVNTFDNC